MSATPIATSTAAPAHFADAMFDAGDAPQLRTILLTDICDSTGLVEVLGDKGAAQLFREHDRLVLGLQQQWRGRLIDRSDGLLLLFERPIDGLGFAIDYARGLAEIGKLRSIDIKIRAGLHVGEVLTWRNSEESVRVGAKPIEVEGLAKPTAARLMSMARPGQILLSAVAEPLAHRAARELGERGQHLIWKSLGRWRFKGVPEPQEIFEVGEPGLAPLRAPANSPKAWRAVPLWRRPAMLAAQLALVVAVGIGGWFVTRPAPAIAFGERDWVVVGDLRNLTGQTVLDESLEQAFRISLEQSRHVNVLSDLKTRDTLARMQLPADTVIDRDIASEIALRDGARAVILPTVAEVGGRVQFSAEVIEPASQTTVYTESASASRVEDTLESIDEVTASLRRGLGEALESIQTDSKPLAEATTRNLDALRAYSLGVTATAERRWPEAQRLFQRAIELDPDFALAHMGLVRIHWSSINYETAIVHLDKATELRDSLPPRDQLYLDAWKAETRGTGTPLQEWKLLASMYPDYFAAAANASWYLIVDNQFREAMPFAAAASVSQYPLRAFALDHLGRIHMALGAPERALALFLQSEQSSGGQPIRYRADALAVLGRYDEAWETLSDVKPSPDTPSSLYSNLERVSIALDQGNSDLALRNAAHAVEQAQAAGDDQLAHFKIVELSARMVAGKSISEKELQSLAAGIELQLDAPETLDRSAVAFRLLTLAFIAHRSGHLDWAEGLVSRIGTAVDTLENPNIDRLRGVLRASRVRIKGDPEQAVVLLSKQIDGQELIQTRVALMHAYSDAGREAEARQQAEWIKRNLGRAYVEINVDQLLQPLNVADARAAIGTLRG